MNEKPLGAPISRREFLKRFGVGGGLLLAISIIYPPILSILARSQSQKTEAKIAGHPSDQKETEVQIEPTVIAVPDFCEVVDENTLVFHIERLPQFREGVLEHFDSTPAILDFSTLENGKTVLLLQQTIEAHPRNLTLAETQKKQKVQTGLTLSGNWEVRGNKTVTLQGKAFGTEKVSYHHHVIHVLPQPDGTASRVKIQDISITDLLYTRTYEDPQKIETPIESPAGIAVESSDVEIHNVDISAGRKHSGEDRFAFEDPQGNIFFFSREEIQNQSDIRNAVQNPHAVGISYLNSAKSIEDYDKHQQRKLTIADVQVFVPWDGIVIQGQKIHADIRKTSIHQEDGPHAGAGIAVTRSHDVELSIEESEITAQKSIVFFNLGKTDDTDLQTHLEQEHPDTSMLIVKKSTISGIIYNYAANNQARVQFDNCTFIAHGYFAESWQEVLARKPYLQGIDYNRQDIGTIARFIGENTLIVRPLARGIKTDCLLFKCFCLRNTSESLEEMFPDGLDLVLQEDETSQKIHISTEMITSATKTIPSNKMVFVQFALFQKQLRLVVVDGFGQEIENICLTSFT